jgi:hypothetical protein
MGHVGIDGSDSNEVQLVPATLVMQAPCSLVAQAYTVFDAYRW